MQRAQEDDLQPDVHNCADQHRPDDGERDVASRVTGLPSELDDLLEAQVGEDYAPGGYSAQDALDPERGEAPGRGEVGGVEGQDHQGEYGEEGDGDLPHRDRVVGLRQAGHAKEVYDRKQGHQHHGHDDARPRQDRHTGRRRGEPREVVGEVLKGGLDLDGRHRAGPDPHYPADREARGPPEGEERIAGGTPRYRVHAPELGVDERQEQHHQAAGYPGEYRGGARDL